jgi:hypothetical protein
MESASVSVQITEDKSIISEMLVRILEKLSNEERERIETWLPLIEEHVEQLILGLKRKAINARRYEILAAASIYDAFLEYESRSSVKFRLPLMEETFHLRPCSINSTWTRLFNKRVLLRKDYLIPVYSNSSFTHRDAVDAVLTNIKRALFEKRDDVETWIDEIRLLTFRLLETMDNAKAAEYDTVLVGIAAIYAAIRKYPGQPRIQISQRDLAQFCNHSPAMLSKIWLDLFALEKKV